MTRSRSTSPSAGRDESPTQRKRRPAPTRAERTVIGVGTQGIGQGTKSDPAKAAYNDWLRMKTETCGASVAESSQAPQYSPREQAQRQRELVAEARAQHREQQRQLAVTTVAESKQLLARARNERREVTEMRRARVHVTKEADEAAHKAAVETHDQSRHEEMRQAREQLQRERAINKQLLEESRRAEAEQIAHSKAQWKAVHDQSREQIAKAREQRLAAIREEKVKDRQRLDKWRDESRRMRVEQASDTKHKRVEEHEGVARSRDVSRDERAQVVASTRTNLQQAQTVLEARREARERQLRLDIERTKAAQESHFAERLREIEEQRRKTADDLRARSIAGRQELGQEREQRRAEARERRQAVRDGMRTGRSTSP